MFLVSQGPLKNAYSSYRYFYFINKSLGLGLTAIFGELCSFLEGYLAYLIP